MSNAKQRKRAAQSIRSVRWSSLALCCALTCGMVSVCGCHSNSAASGTAASRKQYSVRGKVISVDQKDGVIALDTEAIPGFMKAMTMAYFLENPAEASRLHPGDKITAQLQLNAQGAVLSDIDIVPRREGRR
jgi:protein SCO1